jgi:hypothetical protein
MESKKFELRREGEEIDISLVTTDIVCKNKCERRPKKDVNFRLDVIKYARRHILHLHIVFEAERLRLRDSARANANRIQSLHLGREI